MKSLQTMPKVELHVHLDGSVRPLTACELSGKPIEVVKEQMFAPDRCIDLNDYLTKFSFPLSLLQTKDNLMRVASELIADLEKDGILYAEIRFAPILHTRQGLSLSEVVEAVLEGLKKGNIKWGLILCLMRNETEENNKKIITLAKEYLGKGVVGLDLAGAEGIFPTEQFSECFAQIKEENIPFTIHAGEAAGCKSIETAISFGAKRLGHGIRIIENESLISVAREKQITLEVCPTSNVQTNVIPSYQQHPIALLYHKGMFVTVNTDNRTVSHITLTEEYQKLQETFEFSLNDFKKMNLNAIHASFLSCEEKKTIEEEYLLKWEQYTKNLR